MNCPRCRAATYVTNSRPTGDSVRRRRKCPKCGRRLTTFESPIDLPNLLLALKARLRCLEEEVGNIVDVAAKYMNGRLRRSKRGPSQSLRVNDLLNRRQRVKMNEAEVARLAEAYRSARDQRDLANDLGITTTQLRYRLYKHGITKRGLPNGAEPCQPINLAPTNS